MNSGNPFRIRPIRPTACIAVAALLVGSLGACSPVSSSAPPVWLGQFSQGSEIIRIPVRSWNERKFDNVVRQRADFSCGAAAMATVFNYGFGYETTEQQVLVNMLKIADPDIVREKGFSLLDMKTYAQELGMQAEGYQVEYDKLLDLRVPMIALIDLRGYKHFVVLRAAFDDKIAVADPALGNRMMTREAFEEAWNSVIFIVLDDGFDPASELFNPPSPLSAKLLLATHADLPAAAAAEFGINQGFDFSF